MKAATLILLPLGLVAIAYAVTLTERSRPVPPFVTPEWATDRYGRQYPANFNPPPAAMPGRRAGNCGPAGPMGAT